MARNYFRNIQRQPTPNQSLQEDDVEGGPVALVREGVWRDAVPFRAESKAASIQRTPATGEAQVIASNQTEINQTHTDITNKTSKYVKYIDAGKETSINLVFFQCNIPATLDYHETQILLNSEKDLFSKYKKTGDASLLLPYNEAAKALEKKFSNFEKLELHIKKINAQVLQDIVSIHNLLTESYTENAALELLNPSLTVFNSEIRAGKTNGLLRILQSSFSYKEVRNEAFKKLYHKDLFDFVKRYTKGGGEFDWYMARAYLKEGKLRPVDKFYIAVKGVGTDVDNVFFAMEQAHKHGVQKIEDDYMDKENGYPTDNEGKGALPHTGNISLWFIAGRIDDDMKEKTDDNIKAKALLSHGEVRPVDKIRMALYGDRSTKDLKSAIREAQDQGKNKQDIEAEYSKSYGNMFLKTSDWSLSKEIENYKEDLKLKNQLYAYNPGFDKNSIRKFNKIVDKEFDDVNRVFNGEETTTERFIAELKTDEKQSTKTFAKLPKAERKKIIDLVLPFGGGNWAKKLQSIYYLEDINNACFVILRDRQIWDYASFNSFVKYSIRSDEFKTIVNALRNDNPFYQLMQNLIAPPKKEHDIAWTLHYTKNDTELFQSIIASKDKEWATHFVLNILTPARKETFKNHIGYFVKNTSIKDVKHLTFIKALLSGNPEARIKNERDLLRKANSGLGAGLTNAFSTSGLSAEVEQRELEVDLKIALFNDGQIDAKEAAAIEGGIQNAQRTRANFEEIRDGIENVATMIIQGLIVATASVLIPGAGGIIATGLISGASNVLVNKIMKNDRYDLSNSGSDFLSGMIDGLLGGAAGKAIATVGKGSGMAAKVMKSKIMREVSEEALGSAHSLVVDIIKGKPVGTSMEDYVKGIFQGVATGRITEKYTNAITSMKQKPGAKTTHEIEINKTEVPATKNPDIQDRLVNSNADGSISAPKDTLHPDMPDKGSIISDPLHYITGNDELQVRLDGEISYIELEISKQKEGQQKNKSHEKDIKDLQSKLDTAKKARERLKDKHDRTTVEDAQNALKDIRDMKLYRTGKEVILYDVPEGASYLSKDGSPITLESEGIGVMQEVFNSDPQREVGLWRDNSTTPPTYFVIQGSSFNVKFNTHGHYDLINHTHPAQGTAILDSLASMGDFNHLIVGKSPKKPQYLESKIHTHKGKQLRESSFIAESNGHGKWEFSIKFTRSNGTTEVIKIDSNIILKNNKKKYDELMNTIDYRESQNLGHKSSDDFDTPTKENKKINKDNKGSSTKIKNPDSDAVTDSVDKDGTIDEVASLTHRDIMQMIDLAGGRFDDAIDLFGSMPQGKQLVARLQEIRQNIVKDLANYEAELLGNASTELKSDMDFNIKGPNAGRKLMFLDQKLRKQFGDNYQQALKISLFTHAGRLTHYTSLKGSKNFAGIEQMITAHSETLNLARMYHNAQGNPVELARIEKMMATKNRDEILAWATKLGANAHAQHEKLLLEVDALEIKYSKTNDPDLKALLSEKITKKQMEANFYNQEAYIAPGSMMPDGGKSVAERRQTVMSQIEMITHKISEYRLSNGDVSKEYEVYKYLSRVHDELVASGIEIDPKLKTIFALSEGIYRGDRSFYDLKLRPKEDRQATLYAALEAIKDILP